MLFKYHVVKIVEMKFYMFLRVDWHTFSSESSWTPKPQPNNSKAVVWLSFCYWTRLSADTPTIKDRAHKGTIFFFSRMFVFVGFLRISDEWMKKLVFSFFSVPEKKIKTALESNEWMACELFRGKKKTQQQKKTHTNLNKNWENRKQKLKQK